MEKNDGGAQKHSRGKIREMLPKVAESLGKVCTLARKVFRKRLNKICDIHCVVCFMPKDRIPFGQTSYV